MIADVNDTTILQGPPFSRFCFPYWLHEKNCTKSMVSPSSRTQTRLYNFAFSLLRHKNYTAAYGILRAANVHFRTLHPSSFDQQYTSALDDSGLEALMFGDPSYAERCFRASLKSKARTLPSGHWKITASMVNLAQALGVQGRLEEAESLLWWSLRWHADRLGTRHKEGRDVVSLLAWMLEESGRWAGALGLYVCAYAGARCTVGEHHDDTREYRKDCVRVLTILQSEGTVGYPTSSSSAVPRLLCQTE
jgi:hypothetical protein